MGYEIARLVSVINDEFLCSICTMVLENPIQSPCEHIFCIKCIKDWLKVEARCPVDRSLLTLDDMKPTPRYFRNLLDKVEVKCNFELKGCQEIVPLEQLQNHLTKCSFNPNSDIICDGCNIKMNRREYEVSNCFTHLTNRVSRQQSHFENIISRQEEQITQLQDKVTKLNEEMSRVRCQETQSENEIRLLQEKLSKLNHKSSISLYTPPKCHWRIYQNMKTCLDQQNILEYDGIFGNAFAQLFYSVEPASSCFKIRILRLVPNSISVGLTQKQHPTDIPPGLCNLSAGYRCNGELFVDRRGQKIGKPWKAGDIIECGINYVSDGTNSVEIYFSINEQLIAKNLMIVASDLARDGLFPTIFMWGPPGATRKPKINLFPKVEYLIN